MVYIAFIQIMLKRVLLQRNFQIGSKRKGKDGPSIIVSVPDGGASSDPG